MRHWVWVLTLVSVMLASPGARAQEECSDDIYAVVEGNAVTIFHDGALYNCCPTDFGYDLTIQEQTIAVLETEILEEPCYCVCCIDLSVEIVNVPPGEYTVEFRWYDYETWEWRMWPLEISVGGEATPPEPAIGDTFFSDCHTADVEVEYDATPSWGMIKAWYR